MIFRECRGLYERFGESVVSNNRENVTSNEAQSEIKIIKKGK